MSQLKIAFVDLGDDTEKFEIFGNATDMTGLYEMGYMNNGLMLLPPSSLFLVAIYIWVQKARSPELIEE